jgi:hypothetical protein
VRWGSDRNSNFHREIDKLAQMLYHIYRLDRLATIALFVTLSLGAQQVARGAEAVEHRGVIYVAVADLLGLNFLDGAAESPDKNTLVLRWAGRTLRFDEGGDRAAVDDGEARRLRYPVLVLESKQYVAAEESAALFGYSYHSGPPPTLVINDRRLTLQVTPLDLPHFTTRVEDLRPVRRAIVLIKPVAAKRHLHAETPTEQLAAGTTLLVRREVQLDGVAHAIATRADESIETYAIPLADLRHAARDASLDGTHLGGVLARMSELASQARSIAHGPRDQLPQTVAITVDLCWSIRPYERDFFRFVSRFAAEHGEAWITLFVTGRWLEQHPEEMEKLIALSREPGVGVTWALHSWVHPKRQPFMISYSPAEVQEDNLRTEAELLRWGIVPSIFYRFPGLIHDEERLRAILELDLVSVNCDSWVASMRLRRPPHHFWPSDGSILLIHGNGNEPVGIPRLYEWMIETPGWKWGKLHRFITPAVAPDARSE